LISKENIQENTFSVKIMVLVVSEAVAGKVLLEPRREPRACGNERLNFR